MNPIVLKSLINSLNDENPGVRAKAAEALGKIKDKSAVEKLSQLLDDEDAQVKESAEKALQNMGVIVKEIKVPEWNTYYPSLEEANKEQKEFYNKLIAEFKKDNYLDIDGNLSYVFVYLYSLLEDFFENKDIDSITNAFDKIYNAYGEYVPIKDYLIIWRADVFEITGDYKKALDIRRIKGLGIYDVFKYSILLPDPEDFSLNGKDLISLQRSHLTDFGKKYTNEISEVADVLLDEFRVEHGKMHINYFLEEFNLNDLSENDFNVLKTFFKDEEEFLKYKQTHEQYFVEPGRGPGMQIYLKTFGFQGVTFNSEYMDNFEIIEKNKVYVPSIVIEALENEFGRLLRESENIIREQRELPKVGEGWISETELYYLIKEAFPKEKIIQHGRPSWLKPQHLDVYFPKKNIGLEYQGDQHQKPIKCFGGEEGLQKRIELDKRKEKHCKENNCYLIYVYPNYDFEEVKKQIKIILKDSNEDHTSSKHEKTAMNMDPFVIIKKSKELLDDGLITEEKYQEIKERYLKIIK